MEEIDRTATLIQEVESQPRGNDGNKEYFYCWKKRDSDQGVP